jgi:DNA modification methylase
MTDKFTLEESEMPCYTSPCGRVTLYHGDCLEIIPLLESVEAVITDPPYGSTSNAWDMSFIHDADTLKSITVGNFVCTAIQPVSSQIVCRWLNHFKHEIIWDRVNKLTNFFNCKSAPLRAHESVLVFCFGKYTYNPQKQPRNYTTRRTKVSKTSNYSTAQMIDNGRPITEGSPESIIGIKGNLGTNHEHPTQKPIQLMEYLISTYSDVGSTILDPYMGSGTTGIACLRTGRRFIGIERDPAHFATALKRITNELEGDLFLGSSYPAP